MTLHLSDRNVPVTTAITSEAIEAAAAAVSDGSWGSLGGGFLVFGADDLSGGAWYSAGSRPDVRGCVTITVPSGSVSVEQAREIVLDVIAEEGEPDDYR
jgi:hypothetical protein